MSTRFRQDAEDTLTCAGWYPVGRSTPRCGAFLWKSQAFVLHEAAERFLAEFGGLSVEDRGLGITCAREPFEPDPLLTLGENDRFGEWGASIGRVIAPLGELDHGDSGLESLLLGLMPRRFLAEWGPARPPGVTFSQGAGSASFAL